jgi:hypothetical protein
LSYCQVFGTDVTTVNFARSLYANDICGLHLSMQLVLYGVDLHRGSFEFIYIQSERLSEAPITFVFLLMERNGIVYSFFNIRDRWGGWSKPQPGPLHRGKTRYQLYGRLRGLQGRSGKVSKTRPHRDSINVPSKSTKSFQNLQFPAIKNNNIAGEQTCDKKQY